MIHPILLFPRKHGLRHSVIERSMILKIQQKSQIQKKT